MKRLVVNADDFGFTRGVNAGIVEAHRNGILTAATLMATGEAFEDAAALARQNPSLDIGVHLVLVGAPGFPQSLPELLLSVVLQRIPIYFELVRQVRRVVNAGLEPTHLDAHKHTHILPPVLDAVARISEEFGIPWVRRPFDFPMTHGGAGAGKRLVSLGLSGLRGRFHRVLSAHHCRTTDNFAGFQITGNYGPAELARLIGSLPEGSTEFMCHPGYCTGELRAAKTRLTDSRERELRALTSSDVKQAILAAGVELTNYRKLSAYSSRST